MPWDSPGRSAIGSTSLEAGTGRGIGPPEQIFGSPDGNDPQAAGPVVAELTRPAPAAPTCRTSASRGLPRAQALLRSLGLGLLLVTGKILTPASAQETAASPSPGGVAFDLEALSVVPEVFPAKELEVEGRDLSTPVRSLRGSRPDLRLPRSPERSGRGPQEGPGDRPDPRRRRDGVRPLGQALERPRLRRHRDGPVWLRAGRKLWQVAAARARRPSGWDASFGQLDSPVEDQWTYHAVSAVALGHTLLRPIPMSILSGSA